MRTQKQDTRDALGSDTIRRYVGDALTRYRVDYKGGFATSDPFWLLQEKYPLTLHVVMVNIDL